MVKPFGRKDENSSTLISYHGRLVFRVFFGSYYNALGISSPKIKSLRLFFNNQPRRK